MKLDWPDSLLLVGAGLMIAGVGIKDWAIAMMLLGLFVAAFALFVARR